MHLFVHHDGNNCYCLVSTKIFRLLSNFSSCSSIVVSLSIFRPLFAAAFKCHWKTSSNAFEIASSKQKPNQKYCCDSYLSSLTNFYGKKMLNGHVFIFHSLFFSWCLPICALCFRQFSLSELEMMNDKCIKPNSLSFNRSHNDNITLPTCS